jgi:hypothetical protein
MAEEVVVREPLTNEMLDAGREITRLLAASDFRLVCSLWLYSSDSNEWRLMVSSPLVEEEGPKSAYGRIGRLLPAKLDAIRGFDMLSITAVSPDQPPVVAIRSAFKTDGFCDIRLTRSRIKNVFIEDGHILYVK